jgi:hypothetical protein
MRSHGGRPGRTQPSRMRLRRHTVRPAASHSSPASATMAMAITVAQEVRPARIAPAGASVVNSEMPSDGDAGGDGSGAIWGSAGDGDPPGSGTAGLTGGAPGTAGTGGATGFAGDAPYGSGGAMGAAPEVPNGAGGTMGAG